MTFNRLDRLVFWLARNRFAIVRIATGKIVHFFVERWAKKKGQKAVVYHGTNNRYVHEFTPPIETPGLKRFIAERSR